MKKRYHWIILGAILILIISIYAYGSPNNRLMAQKRITYRDQVNMKYLHGDKTQITSLGYTFSQNQSEIMNNVNQSFEQIFSAIEQAKDHVHIEFFIIRDDAIGQRMKRILAEKVRQGVEVRFIYDAVGSMSVKRKFIADCNQAGIKMVAYKPILASIVRGQLNHRNHKKIVVVDGEVGFTGGINLGDEYLGKKPGIGFWRDLVVKIKGPAVEGMQAAFLEDWYLSTGEKILQKKYYQPHASSGAQQVMIVTSEPDMHKKEIEKLFSGLINNAKEEILISTPYFIPEKSLNNSLIKAIQRGVRVEIMIPEHPDVNTTYLATQGNLGSVLSAGATVWKYRKGFLHAKSMIVDQQLTCIGSANFDKRGLSEDAEICVLMADEKTARAQRSWYEEDIKHSKRLTLKEYQSRPLWDMIGEKAVKIFENWM
ncbi:cardiolipin synthase [Candidatus Formimonas warabiya]|uniref:Cardiolipin synthase n=1 Tax=Formimonas warabiya TaxID=1761012 RepID=A0A3G1KV94_FORW1|nr:cardiolipin synthase [Candidatus Formimonas warabiya]ATW26356.1 cardiolipin synthase [Candidatus Formimonas warabiya]